jgi:hypothetical protein
MGIRELKLTSVKTYSFLLIFTIPYVICFHPIVEIHSNIKYPIVELQYLFNLTYIL